MVLGIELSHTGFTRRNVHPTISTFHIDLLIPEVSAAAFLTLEYGVPIVRYLSAVGEHTCTTLADLILHVFFVTL